MLDELVIGLTCGIWGYLIVEVLSSPGEVLHPFARSMATWKNREPESIARYWLWKITFGCAKCVAGNLGLLFSFFFGDNVGEALCIVGLAIFSAYIFERNSL